MQSHNTPYVIIIDPTDMTDDEALILYYVLENQARLGVSYFQKNTSYPIPKSYIQNDTDINIGAYNNIKLTHHIIRRSRTRDENQYRYEVFGKPIGSGGYGKIYNVVGTLFPLEDHRLSLKTNKARVIKEMNKRNAESLKRFANQEYNMARRDEELGAKPPVFAHPEPSSKRMHSYMVMRFIPGEELQKIIDRDQENKENVNDIDTDTRIKMSIAAARAMKKVHLNNIVHCDIKSGNVIMDVKSPIIKAKVIDYGGSKDKQCMDSDFIYTGIFAAPEIHAGDLPSQKSDIFSGSWVFNDIWRGDDHPANDLKDKLYMKMNDAKHPMTDKMIKKKKKEINEKILTVSQHCKFKNLFIGINDLEKSHRHSIEQALKKNTNKSLDKRGYFDDLIQVFETISYERLINKIPPVDESDKPLILARDTFIHELKVAHLLGIQLRNKLDKFVKWNYCDITLDDLIEMQSLFLDQSSGVPALSDKPEVISLFVERLQIMTFAGLTSKQAILEKLYGIIDTCVENIKIMASMENQIIELKKRLNQLTHMFERTRVGPTFDEFNLDLKKIENEVQGALKYQKHQLTLEKIESLNIKLAKQIKKINDALLIFNGNLNTKLDDSHNVTFIDACVNTVRSYTLNMGLFSHHESREIPKERHVVRLTLKNYR